MKEIVKIEEVLDLVLIDNIKTLEQADEILAMCNASDDDVVETYVQNAITRGAVYHKLTKVEKPNGSGEYITQEDIAERYNVGKGTVSRYFTIFENRDILLQNLADNPPHVGDSLNPNLRSLLDSINKDPVKIGENILLRISHNKMSPDTERGLLSYFENKAPEYIRYAYSTKGSVSNGKLLIAINSEDEALIYKTIMLNGNSISSKDFKLTREECKNALKEKDIEIERLTSEVGMLSRKNRFLMEMNSANEISQLLRRMTRKKIDIKKFKQSFIDACNVMGVDTDITEDDLKKIYRKKVSIHHPDKNGNEEMFKQIAEANAEIKKFIKGL